MVITPIAEISTPYQSKFAIPRQPGLVTAARGEINFLSEYSDVDMVRGLDQFSHIWLIFSFHQTAEQGWKPMVRPPRLGGNKQVGVLASRSTFRPNPLGLSLVKLDAIRVEKNTPSLIVSGIDLVDKTPILDIKPYLPYADAKIDALGGYAEQEPTNISVKISAELNQQLETINRQHSNFSKLVEQVLAQDPRPAYRKGKTDNKTYGVTLYDYDVRFHYPSIDRVELLDIRQL